MADALPPRPDWRDKIAYAPLAELEASGFAWEWLRRDPAYRREAEAACSRGRGGTGEVGAAEGASARWGLHRFEHPGLTAREARPVWTAAAHPFVLDVQAEPRTNEEPFDPAPIAPFLTVVAERGGEHVLICDGSRSIRLDVEGSLFAGPSRLSYRLSGLRRAEGPLLVLRRFLAFWRRRKFSRILHPPMARAARHLLLLRTHDALLAGASQREIAAELVSRAADAPRWRIETPSSRLAAQRLVRDARRLSAGAWRQLLR